MGIPNKTGRETVEEEDDQREGCTTPLKSQEPGVSDP